MNASTGAGNVYENKRIDKYTTNHKTIQHNTYNIDRDEGGGIISTH